MTAFGLILILMMVLGTTLLCTAALAFMVQKQNERRSLVARRYAGEAFELVQGEAQKQPVALVSADKRHTHWRLAGISPTMLRSFKDEVPKPPAIALALAGPALLFATASLLGLPIGLSILVTAVLTPIIGIAAIRIHSRRRASQIEARLAEALDVVARCLRIGMPVSAALRVVARDLTGPIAQEFATVADRVSYGKDLVTALRDMAERGHSPSLSFFSAAIAVQVETGGNLVEVIERLARLARERTQLQRKIKAMTAEAKWSGRFLSAFPILAAIGIAAINPDYFSNVWDKPYLVPLSLVIGALLIGNIIFMQRLVRFE